MLHESVGMLRYGYSNVVLDVDQGIVDYYRALMPRHIRANRQMYPAHISIVRKETPQDMSSWGVGNGMEIRFLYENIVRFGEVYCWLDVYSVGLEDVRHRLGLEVSSRFNTPAPGFAQTFHITLGNFKAQPS